MNKYVINKQIVKCVVYKYLRPERYTGASRYTPNGPIHNIRIAVHYDMQYRRQNIIRVTFVKQ